MIITRKFSIVPVNSNNSRYSLKEQIALENELIKEYRQALKSITPSLKRKDLSIEERAAIEKFREITKQDIQESLEKVKQMKKEMREEKKKNHSNVSIDEKIKKLTLRFKTLREA